LQVQRQVNEITLQKVDQLLACLVLMFWCDLQVQRESQVYESTLQKMNQQLQASLDLMAGEKAALQLSLAGLQDQFEGVAQAVYTADEAVVGQTPCSTLVCHIMHPLQVRHPCPLIVCHIMGEAV
jgi:hypothetical protein